MTQTIMHPVYGAISYEENIWTGKKSLAVNGKYLKKGRKNVFTLEDGENTLYVTLKGNALTGVTATIQGQDIVILPKLSGLDYILCILPFALIMIWGNSQALCSIVPVVGGAIGGAIGAIFACESMMLMRKAKSTLIFQGRFFHSKGTQSIFVLFVPAY